MNGADAVVGVTLAGKPLVEQGPVITPEVGEPACKTFRPWFPAKLNFTLISWPAFAEFAVGAFATGDPKPVKAKLTLNVCNA